MGPGSLKRGRQLSVVSRHWIATSTEDLALTIEMTSASVLFAIALVAADPAAEQLGLLKTFRSEFVQIDPAKTGLAPYAVAKYEVPQNLWQAVMGDNPSRWKGPRNSVEMVALEDARRFCRQATELIRSAGLIEQNELIRLPTEAEWEHAARAGTTTKYSFGDDSAQLGEYAWFTGNAAGNDPPVGAKKPNPWGLYDVHGYLWEWTIESATKPYSARTQTAIRGGSWKDEAAALESTSRRIVSESLRDAAVGFRCVLATQVSAQEGALPGGSRLPLPSSAVVSLQTASFTPTTQDKIVPAGAGFEKLWDEGEFTEGPALAPDGSIFFSDIGESIYRYDPKSKQTALFRRPSGRANGLMFSQQGDLLACEGANTGGNRRISITTGINGGKDGAVRTLADRYDGKRFNSPNDLAIDAQGRVYFSDPRYRGDEPRELDFEAVFLVSSSGEVKIASRDVSKPNGILVAPDGKSVYVSDHDPQGSRHLLAFNVKADGTLDGKRVLFDFGTGRGIDGMTLDTAGNIFATAGTGDKAGIYVFDPMGKALAFVPTPGDPTNCVFGGGDDRATLYVTCANSKQSGTKYGLYAIKLNAVGHHIVTLK
jgi:gluconolactonase